MKETRSINVISKEKYDLLLKAKNDEVEKLEKLKEDSARLTISIKELNFPARISTAFRQAQINFLQDAIEIYQEKGDFTRIRNIGKGADEEIKTYLQPYINNEKKIYILEKENEYYEIQKQIQNIMETIGPIEHSINKSTISLSDVGLPGKFASPLRRKGITHFLEVIWIYLERGTFVCSKVEDIKYRIRGIDKGLSKQLVEFTESYLEKTGQKIG